MKRLTINIIKSLTIVSFILFFKGCSEREVEIQKEITSPNRVYTAYAYSFNGGATVSFNQCISIIKSDESKAKDILVSDLPNIYFKSNTNSKDIDIQWEDDKTLKIICNKDSENIDYVKLKVDIFNGIKIKYE